MGIIVVPVCIAIYSLKDEYLLDNGSTPIEIEALLSDVCNLRSGATEVLLLLITIPLYPGELDAWSVILMAK